MLFRELLRHKPATLRYHDADIFPLPGLYTMALDNLKQNWMHLRRGQRCPKCGRPGEQEYYDLSTKWGTYRYDISRAHHLTQDGRSMWYFRPQDLFDYVRESQIVEDHLAHMMTAAEPGIFAYIAAPNGTIGAQLIDGNHRAVHALLERQYFAVYVLTPEESTQCLITAPRHPKR